MAKDYYQVLGVAKTATKKEIGKAYRALAKQFHPDLHPDDAGAKKRFQEIQEAYDVLNNDEKRKLYDQYGPDFEQIHAAGGHPGGFPGGGFPGGGFPGGGFRGGRTGAGQGGPQWQEFTFDGDFQGGGFDPGMFGSFAEAFRNRASGAGPGRRRRTPVKGNDLSYDLTVMFEESVLGCERDIRIQSSSGEVKSVTAKIPPGIEDGKKLRLRGLGEASMTGGPSGDLVLNIHVEPHPVFSRQGNDLLLRLPVTLSEAALGARVPIPTPKGQGTLNIPPGTSSGKKLRIKGAGVPSKTGAGDLLVEILVNVPRSVTESQAAALRELDGAYPADLRAGITW